MKKRKVAVVELLSKSKTHSPFSRYLRATNAGVMPQAVTVWCEEMGHHTDLVYYAGPEILSGKFRTKPEIVFISSFTQSAQLAYALANCFGSQGIVTVLGGPHARAYPEDAQRYFDYVVGFTTRELIADILADCAHHSEGRLLSAAAHPRSLPGVRERWSHICSLLGKASVLRPVPMLGSLGCPYKCSFCIDADVAYQTLDYDAIRSDLRFLATHRDKGFCIAWHDPNFAVRFNEYLDVIEDAVPSGGLRFIAESSLSLLSEANAKRLNRAGCLAIATGVESWFDMAGKAGTPGLEGEEKARRLSEQFKMLTAHIPFVQANFIPGLDVDRGEAPFRLTRDLVRRAPAVFPQVSLLTAFGRSAPQNLELQQQGRVLSTPFHFLNSLHGPNVRPLHYTWPEFLDGLCQLMEEAFSVRSMARRFHSGKEWAPSLEQVFRGWSSNRGQRLRCWSELREHLKDPAVRSFLEGETRDLPDVFIRPVRKDLGPLWEWLPKGALEHEPNAYLASVAE